MTRALFRRPWVALLALSLCLSAPALGEGVAVGAVPEQLARAERLFQDWQYDEGIALAERLYTQYPGLPPVQYLAAKAKFYQQDYAGAVALFERATAAHPAKGGREPLLEFARATHEITQGFVVARSPHFELRVAPGPDELLAPYALDALERAWAALGDDLGWRPSRPVVVEAYRSAAELSAATGLSTEAIKTSGTIAVCKHNKLMFTSPGALLRGYEWLDTLSHEYVHYVVSVVSHNTVPIWLHEGLAKFQETRWSGEAGRALSPYSESLLAEVVRGKRELITFAQMHPSMALLPSQEHAALAFAEVFTAIEYLVRERGGYPAVRKLLAGLRTHHVQEKAFPAALGVSFSDFEASWRAWLLARPFKTQAGAQAEAHTFKSDLKGKAPESAEEEADASAEVGDAKAKRFTHLGELLRARGRHKAAAAEYEKAYALVGAEAPLLSSKLALTHMALKRYDRAEEVLLAALGPNPTFVTTHVHLGRLYFEQERWGDAELAYLRANEINPFDPEIHLALFALYDKSDRPALAKREARAVELIRRGPVARPGAVAEDARAYLSLNSKPWARVEIDGESLGLTTPIFRYPLAPGRHTLRLLRGEEVIKAWEVELSPGQTHTEEFELP